MPFSNAYYSKMLARRNKKANKYRDGEPNYFKIQKFLELDKYSTYIIITPRSIGKSYSGWETCIGFYESSGEYTCWMRNSDTEIKEVVADYKANRPASWPEYAQIRGRSLIDDRNGKLIAKFVALSTVGNLASITGDGCAMIYFDEFLPRDGKKAPTNSYNRLTDFIKTLERGDLLTVVLTANMTTLNSEFITKWDLWLDEPVLDDLKRRIRWRYIKEWENPPVVDEISTAKMWASNDEGMLKFMENADVLDNSGALVIPESRLGSMRWFSMFMYNEVEFTLGMTDDNKYVCVLGARMKGGFIQDLTTLDGYVPRKRHVRPPSVSRAVSQIAYGLETNNLLFTDFSVKDAVFDLLRTLNGKITGR